MQVRPLRKLIPLWVPYETIVYVTHPVRKFAADLSRGNEPQRNLDGPLGQKVGQSTTGLRTFSIQ